ncbi:Mitochondrial acidic protein mam33 [Ceratobasidium sp. 392]|nr:Mitochondrial acidic protein mam33 [Ceratobasidium sp. 392]
MLTLTNQRLDIQSPNSPQPAPRNTSTAPPTPTKKNKSSVGPVRTPKRKFANAVNSSNFAVCMVSPEQAARAAGERRRGKATFGSPRSRKRARSDDEVQSPRSTRQRTLRKRAAHTEAASTMQSIGAEPTSIRDLAPILPEQRVEEPQALVALNQVEASLQGETDLSLSEKLHEEIKFELEAAKANSDIPDFLRDFQSNGVWGIEDTEGNDEVALVRTFGNETIRVLFSIADIDAPQDSAFEGEEAEGEEIPVPIGPVRCSVTISKGSDQGALAIDALAQDGAMVIDNISFYKDAKLATDLSPEADWKRRGLYIGPQASGPNEFDRFLDERGIGGDLALFVPAYAEYKEQKEYVKWLQSVKSFIDV